MLLTLNQTKDTIKLNIIIKVTQLNLYQALAHISIPNLLFILYNTMYGVGKHKEEKSGLSNNICMLIAPQ